MKGNMHYSVWLGLTLLLCLAGCSMETAEAPDTLLTDIYRPVIESRMGSYNTVTAFTESENGYVCAYGYFIRPSEIGQAAVQGTKLIFTDEAGNVTEEQELTAERSLNSCAIGEKGVYGAPLNIENGTYMLTWYGWDGSVLAETSLSEIKPSGASGNVPKAGYYEEMPIAETTDGFALVWGKKCLLLDETLQKTGEIELSGTGNNVFYEDTVLWITCTEKNTRTLSKAENGTVTESYPLPEEFSGINEYEMPAIIACEDGWLYGWDADRIFRWEIAPLTEDTEPVIEDVCNFINSGISGSKVRLVKLLPGENMEERKISIHTTDQSGTGITVGLYEPAADIDLTKITTLTLVCAMTEPSLTDAVVQFNRTHTDVRIELLNYSQYNTDENPRAGYQRLQLDLTNKLIEPDILYTHNYQLQVSTMPDYFTDLYTLMDGEVTADSIYGCVKTTLEKDGKLYGIVPEFSLYTLVGTEANLGDRTAWTMAEFLDYSDSLTEGEYLIEEVGQDNYSWMLFPDGLQYTPFIQGGSASFTDETYVRYLEFLKSLPEEGMTYMDYGSNDILSVMAGETPLDQAEEDTSGENLYYNGTIKLYSTSLTSPVSFLKTANRFGTTELNYIGYPTVGESGTSVGFSGVYTIPKTCKAPDAAWEFIETRLTQGEIVTEPAVSMVSNRFPSVKTEYRDYLNSLIGYDVFFLSSGSGYTAGKDLVPDENGRLNGNPGVLFTFDEALVEQIEEMLENSGTSTFVAAVPDEVRTITMEEESRFLSGVCTAAECADIINSRVGIYLSETAD